MVRYDMSVAVQADGTEARRKKRSRSGMFVRSSRFGMKFAFLLMKNVLAVCLIVSWMGCDPRPPDPERYRSAQNVPPMIQIDSVEPKVETEPTRVIVGENCSRVPEFSVSVEDIDLPINGNLSYIWALVAREGDGDMAVDSLPRVLRTGQTEPNENPDTDVVSSRITYELTLADLRAAFFGAAGVASITTGERTHLLEFYVSDGVFGLTPDLYLDGPVDYFHWPITIEDQSEACSGNG